MQGLNWAGYIQGIHLNFCTIFHALNYPGTGKQVCGPDTTLKHVGFFLHIPSLRPRGGHLVNCALNGPQLGIVAWPRWGKVIYPFLSENVGS